MSLALAREDALPEILQDCADALVTHLEAQTARLWLYSRDSHTLELAGNAGPTAPPRDKWMRVRVDGPSMVSEVARLRTQLRVDDLTHDTRVLDRAWLEEAGVRAFSGMPLMVRGQLVGVLGVYCREPLGEDAAAALAAVSDAIAQGVERRRAEEGRSSAPRSWRAPTKSSSSSPTWPRTTCRSRCAWWPATPNCWAGATRASWTRTRTSSSTTRWMA
ncbi:GAF domain-containing protein [Myxococcus sp. MxC21-1]|uniref:GAF domain-containing protein n=1 Tax=Myxococcus sp. MxC21-1 TaxID=3041439 RepID=UPI00292F86FF|nr:GAF domain-containing protein [Myxococcus sp. MxC21-1]WNZ63077.1 GAF domain-containing protein [Myxococcus sp. MxC21-1]